MIYTNITSATTTQVFSGAASKIIVQNNKALTGTISIYDSLTTTTPVIGIITDPTVGARFEYWGIISGVRVVTSATCDITISISAQYGSV